MSNDTFKKLALTVRWRHVLALNYEVDRQVLLEHVPSGLVLDSYNDRVYLSIVASNLYELHPHGGKIAFFRSVDWISLRTYVRHESVEPPTSDPTAAPTAPSAGYKRGFLSLKNFISKRSAGFVMSFLLRDRFQTEAIKKTTQGFLDTRRNASPSAEYIWHTDGKENKIKVKGRGQIRPSKEDGKSPFFMHHKHWFVSTKKGIMMYEIRQAPWVIWDAASASIHLETSHLLGEPFRRYLKARPSSIYLARGGLISVAKGKRIAR